MSWGERCAWALNKKKNTQILLDEPGANIVFNGGFLGHYSPCVMLLIPFVLDDFVV